MRADFGDVLAGIGMRRRETQRDGVVVRLASRGVDDEHARDTRDAWRTSAAGHELLKDAMGPRPAQANDADGAAARRRRHGDDGVVRSEHVTSPDDTTCAR